MHGHSIKNDSKTYCQRKTEAKKEGRGELERGKKERKTKLNAGNRRKSLGPAQDGEFQKGFSA